MRCNKRRTAFTLLELLVVIGIMLVLATLALFLTPRLADDHRTVRGADVVGGWLLIQKQRAHRDQLPRGVRLVQNTDNPSFVTEMIYIEQPDEWRNPDVQIQIPSPPLMTPPPLPPPVPPPPMGNPNHFRTAFIFNKNLVGEEILPPLFNQTGDILVLDDESEPHSSHRIAYAEYRQTASGQFGTYLVFGSADTSALFPYGTSDRRVDVGLAGVYGPRANTFRIVRQPRAMVGEQPLQLPRDVVIDLANNFGYPALTTDAGHTVLPGNSLDILFNQRGQLMGANSMGGKIILRMRNGDRASNDGDQLLITIYSRTGYIATHPVNVDPPFGSPLHDPYRFVRDGRASGM